MNTGTIKPKEFLFEGSDQIEEFYNNDPTGQLITTDSDFAYMHHIDQLRRVMPGIITSFGLLGNLLILVIFLRQSARHRFNSNSLCFCVLAIADSCALIFMLMRSLLTLQMIGNVAASCKIIKYVVRS